MSASFVGGLVIGVIGGLVAAVIVLRVKEKKVLGPLPPVQVSVAVTTTTPGANPESVQLYKGDSIQWNAGSGVKTFTVDFPGQSPFSTGQFPPGTSVNSGSVTVNPGPGHYISYKYNVTVTPGSGPSVTFDPHVIIMGN